MGSPTLTDDWLSIVSGVPVEESMSKDDSEVVSGVEGHVTRQRPGSVSANNTATRTTTPTPNVMSRSAKDNIAAKSAVDEPAIHHKVRWLGALVFSDCCDCSGLADLTILTHLA